MPVGRKQVAYDDIRYDALTFKIDNSTITFDGTKANGIGKAAGTGDAVTYSANDTVALTQDGNHVVGKLLKVEADGFCTVQKWGLTELPGGNAATLTQGARIVGALGAASARGYIRAVNTAVAAELGVARGDIVNNAVTTGVWVDLG